ncbi:hypothetical protein K461DRAFT_221558 [Myriangium duriaei CBS 260.36]|uniref:Peptide N-acetyl-beta-D-glucosaminyl asparaginase amidase A N-terminal domain-containing protein n=1 Tax=Myriangium duriaei CBS 260.36 TaxID=1168546 RepID=A0A9P4MMZ7_9PEZI|nr:hypothetical protein K461DRAFT_221558 [Myriangium duriaei CBS 260.36]
MPYLGRPGALRFPLSTVVALLLLISPWRFGESRLFASGVYASALPSASTTTADVQGTGEAAPSASSPLLKVIEVDPPVRFEPPGNDNGQPSYSDQGIKPTCQQTLVTYSFALSYGKPYIGQYNPPACQFDRVVWNLTVVSAGRQFDRLGSVSLGSVEVFRTSTAEPTQNGIVWTYLKDMSSFLTLFKKQQTLIFDLGNLINDIYTAPFNVTLSASYYTVGGKNNAADLILPLSQGLTNGPSTFHLPSQNASSSFSIPQNSVKAIFTIAATGQGDEEFWWSNVLQQDINDFPANGALLGYSPFREVQLFIDGKLAGVVWPFPIIFTGGVVPGLWRPIVGIDAFDLKEDEIDVTPWLPLLCDGKSHTFSIKVSGLNPSTGKTASLSETTNNEWWVDGKLFIWLDSTSHRTTGSAPTLSLPPPTIVATSQFQNDSQSNNSALTYQVNVARHLSVTGSIRTSTGEQKVSWQQSLNYDGQGTVRQGGNFQSNGLHISGHDVSSSGYSRSISYPLNCTSLVIIAGNTTMISANLDRGKEVEIHGQPVFPTGLESFGSAFSDPSKVGSLLSTTQEGQAMYIANSTAKTSFSYGGTSQELSFSAVYPNEGYSPQAGTTQLYHRNVAAVNGTTVKDEITDKGESKPPTGGRAATLSDLHGYALVRPGKSGPPGEQR